MTGDKGKKERREKLWTSEKIMSSSALFISVISLTALLYQSYLAREENKLIRKQQSASVLPHLSQWFSDSPEGFKIIIGNKGVGPAFIEETKLTFNDSLVFYNSDELINHIFSSTQLLDSIPVVTSTFTSGYVLPANQTIEIVWIENRFAIRVFREILAKNTLEYAIKYSDVYGQQWILSNSEDNNTPVKILME